MVFLCHFLEEACMHGWTEAIRFHVEIKHRGMEAILKNKNKDGYVWIKKYTTARVRRKFL